MKFKRIKLLLILSSLISFFFLFIIDSEKVRIFLGAISSSLLISCLMLHLIEKQLSFIKDLKVGDKVMFDGREAEILEISDNESVIKTTAPNMRLCKKK